MALHMGATSSATDPELAEQESLIAELREQNRKLTDRLFALEASASRPLDMVKPIFPEGVDASVEVAAARARAIEQGRYLMVTFGANWCMDCRTLYRNLNSDDVTAYTANRFQFVTVDIGKFNRNRQLAEELGVDLSRGIPVAIFFAPDGSVIGTTNEGQLEPARLYSSKQILRFMKDIAERSRILAPDSVGM